MGVKRLGPLCSMGLLAFQNSKGKRRHTRARDAAVTCLASNT
jgi:hypothetical protein